MTPPYIGVSQRNDKLQFGGQYSFRQNAETHETLETCRNIRKFDKMPRMSGRLLENPSYSIEENGNLYAFEQRIWDKLLFKGTNLWTISKCTLTTVANIGYNAYDVSGGNLPSGTNLGPNSPHNKKVRKTQ